MIRDWSYDMYEDCECCGKCVWKLVRRIKSTIYIPRMSVRNEADELCAQVWSLVW